MFDLTHSEASDVMPCLIIGPSTDRYGMKNLKLFTKDLEHSSDGGDVIEGRAGHRSARLK